MKEKSLLIFFATLFVMPHQAEAQGISFADLDVNKDGAISGEEVDSHNEKLFSQQDMNGDRIITKLEYRKVQTEQHDKEASKANSAATAEVFSKIVAGTIDKNFARHDLNNDGAISEEEFFKNAPYSKEWFKQRDSNNDGKTTLEEIKG